MLHALLSIPTPDNYIYLHIRMYNIVYRCAQTTGDDIVGVHIVY